MINELCLSSRSIVGGDAEVANSNPTVPTLPRHESLAESAEGFSYCGQSSYVIEHAVQTHDFRDSTFFEYVECKPFPCKTLRNFNTRSANSAPAR